MFNGRVSSVLPNATARSSNLLITQCPRRYAFKPRSLESLVPTLTTVFSGLSLTALYPSMLPTVVDEPLLSPTAPPFTPP